MTLQETQQKQLKDLMSEISERCYYAGWMGGTEFLLWKSVTKGPMDWGHGHIAEADISALKQLADLTGGWIVSNESAEETFLPMQQWLQIFAAADLTQS